MLHFCGPNVSLPKWEIFNWPFHFLFSGGFTLNGQYNTQVKKRRMVKFCSSHKIALVVSTFSLMVTVGLIITLILMKSKISWLDWIFVTEIWHYVLSRKKCFLNPICSLFRTWNDGHHGQDANVRRSETKQSDRSKLKPDLSQQHLGFHSLH